MKGTASPIAQRIALKLDMAIAFEALILTRLAQLPTTRRQEWLRGLLVRGFQSECRGLRTIQREQPTDTNVPLREPQIVQQTSVSPTGSPVPMPNKPDNLVSFAALRKVIG